MSGITLGDIQASSNSIKISDGTNDLLIDASGHLSINDGGNSITVNDGGTPLSVSISESFDAIDFTYPDQKTEVFKYYSGGIGGNLVATVTVTYYDTGKRKIKSVIKV